MRVLIIGGAGFIGSHTADALLNEGHEVRIFDNLDPQVHGPDRQWPDYLDESVECISGDVRERAALVRALSDIDIVFHLAAATGVGQSMYQIGNGADGQVIKIDGCASRKLGFYAEGIRGGG